MQKETDTAIVQPGNISMISTTEFTKDEYKEYFSKLVNLEREEEMRRHEQEMKNLSGREREKRGRAILQCRARSNEIGYGGTYVVKFVRKQGMPDTEIGVGDLVRISKNNPLSDKNPYGTVIEKTGYSIQVSFNNTPPKWMFHKQVRLDLYVNDVTFKRMLQSINDVVNAQVTNAFLTSSVLSKMSIKSSSDQINSLTFFNKDLNESQKKTVYQCLSKSPFHLIHGPPGTGKTVTCVEVIQQAISRNKTVLACADSNTAVDNLVEKLVQQGKNVVRVGHPARVTPVLRDHSLDYLLDQNETFKKAQQIREKAYALKEKQDEFTFPSGRWRRGLSNSQILKLASKNKSSRGIPADKINEMATSIEFQEKINNLFTEIDITEKRAVREVLHQCDVVCTTNASSGSEVLKNHRFDLCVIDEATQACEPSCLIPIVKADKVIMAGDHKQLPPTILNETAERRGLSISLFERLIALYGSQIKSLLNVQYRMHENIMGFSNHHFYNDKLKADESVKQHTLKDLLEDSKHEKETNRDIFPTANSIHPLIWIDTHTNNGSEWSRPGSTSKENRVEAKLIQNIVIQFLNLGIDPSDIGVITPYYDQKILIRKFVKNEILEVDTVDGFQGREKEIIILSLTRSNPQGNIGFLRDLRRLNVSITRARRKLIVIGDSDTICSDNIYQLFYEYINQYGRILTT